MQKRYPLIDALRGICITLVVFHHIFYDVEAVFGVDIAFLQSRAFTSLRIVVLWVIFITSGISCSLSRDNFRRAGITLLAALAITTATALFYPSGLIVFGVLHCLGTCRLLWAAFGERLCGGFHFKAALLFVLAAVMFLRVDEGVMLIPFHGAVPLPQVGGLGWLGFPDSGFVSADWFPLLTWAPVYFIGGALGSFWQREGFPSLFERDAFPSLSFLGRHTLEVYLLHQPLIMAVLWVSA